ncbi:MAG: V-type ATP synthase subunit F [Thiomargarita sp.]|jgi:vacuolar-type H+-ATPase subunit F/Vma7|nr:V-type ATP synthase subunit F [Thiomargarita sp.]
MKLIFMGSNALADGFALLGFETFPDATTENVESVLSELLQNKENALVFLEDKLTRQPGPSFLRARRESGRIIITEIPPLNAPDKYRPSVEELVARVLGRSVLDKPESVKSV